MKTNFIALNYFGPDPNLVRKVRVRVNFSYVLTYEQETEKGALYTLVRFADNGYVEVKETPHEIDAILEEKEGQWRPR